MDQDHLRARQELWEPAGGPNGMSRRQFLQALGIGTGAAIAAPSVISRLEAFAAESAGGSDGILVLVMLDGGNDSLNTLVPFNDGTYRSLRPDLRIDPPNSGANAALSLDDPNFGLHPSLPKLRARYLQNQVAFVSGVGYTPPDMSHFSSMGYCMQGWKDAPPMNYSNGWAGRFMDTLPGATSNALLGVSMGATVPIHMIGANARAAGLPTSISGAFGLDRSKPYDARMFDAVSAFANSTTNKGQWADLYARTAESTMSLAQTVQPAYSPALAGQSVLKQLTLTARLINLDLGTRVFHTGLGSFDHHGDQRSGHALLLSNLDEAIEALFTNLDAAQRSRVTVLVWSEFGRRPRQNDTGTDHGAAGLSMVIGDKVKGGLYGAQPSLTDLDRDDNLKYNVDFRAVYAEMLGGWMGADPVPILGRDYPRLGLFTGLPTSPSSTTATTASTTTLPPPTVTSTTSTSTPTPTSTSTSTSTSTTTTLAAPDPPPVPPTTATTTTTTTLAPTTTPGTIGRRNRKRRRRRWRRGWNYWLRHNQ